MAYNFLLLKDGQKSLINFLIILTFERLYKMAESACVHQFRCCVVCEAELLY